ncbi:MAG TPA: porin [Chitinophagaceae bacterium]|nr:porin [Chitinophagaceae bacterium]
MKQCILILFSLVIFYLVAGQKVDSAKQKAISFSGFAEVYYCYDFDKPSSKERPGYLYNHKRHNQPGINLALLEAAFTKNKWRANLTLMAGDYAKYNLASEPKWTRAIYEADVGYDFSNKVSIDAGVLPSHIGSESAISKDNWTLSRSLLAENSPYYETGVRLNYEPNDKWSFALLGLNGWQHIKNNNSDLAAGTMVQFKPDDKWFFNSGTFLGNEKPDSVARQLRFFHNFYTIYTISKKMAASVFIDFGTEEKQNNNGSNCWMGLVGKMQWTISDKINTAFRYEYYKDKTGVIISPPSANGFRLNGYTFCFDWKIAKNLLWRNEFRLFSSPDNIFIKENMPKKNNACILSSMAWWF